MNRSVRLVVRGLPALLLAAVVHDRAAADAPAAAASAGESLQPAQLRAAAHPPALERTLLLAVTAAGSRMVAVGERGTVALSDDSGKTFRRARSVPVQATLTGVHFADDRRGWAVGHWGVVLATADGGETWVVQRSDGEHDQPLFGVHFRDARNGLAVGLWSLMLRTTDGGATWKKVSVPPRADERKTDRNLFSVFADARGTLYVTSESGQVLASPDGGASWRYLDTGYGGSLWCGLALPDGGLLVAGLRGTLMRSDDGGSTWGIIPVAVPRSITALATDGHGGVVGAGLDGLYMRSKDGRSFDSRALADRTAFTGVIATTSGSSLLMSKNGPVWSPASAAPAVR